MNKKTIIPIAVAVVLLQVLLIYLFSFKGKGKEEEDNNENNAPIEKRDANGNAIIPSAEEGVAYRLGDLSYYVYNVFTPNENNGSGDVHNYYYGDKSNPDYSGLTITKESSSKYNNSPAKMIAENANLPEDQVQTESLSGRDWYVAYKTADNSTTVTEYYYACAYEGSIYLMKYELTGISMLSNQGLNIIKSTLYFAKQTPVVQEQQTPAEETQTEETI